MNHLQAHVTNDSMKLQSEYEIANGTEGIFQHDFTAMGGNSVIAMGPVVSDSVNKVDEAGVQSNIKTSKQLSLVISGTQHIKTPF